MCLAAGLTAADALRMYTQNGQAIFERVSGGWLKPSFESEALRASVHAVVGDRVLSDSTLRLCIPAVNAAKAEPCIFKTPHHPDYEFDAGELMLDVAMATTAAPTFFPAHSTTEYVLLDGGLIANNPIMVALVDALTCFSLARRQVRILSVGTGGARPLIADYQIDGGRFAWSTVHHSFIHYADKNSLGQAGLLIGRDRIVRLAPAGDEAAIDMTEAARALELLPAAALKAAEANIELICQFVREPDPLPDFFFGRRAVEPSWADTQDGG